MGDFRIVIEAAGPHGCQREVKNGGIVVGCHHMNCPDCLVREFVRQLRDLKGLPISKAELTHWPSDMEGRNYKKENEVKDDLLTGTRSGSF